MTQPAAVPLLRLNQLTESEDATRVRLLGQLTRARKANGRQQDYYEGARRVRDLGIAIPPHLRDLEAVAAWPEIVVDVLDERMDWLGWVFGDSLVTSGGPDPLGLGPIFTQNHLDIEVSQAVLDSLICGVGFLVTGTGRDGEPDVLITAESPNRITGTWSRRLRRCTEAVAETVDSMGRGVGWVLYLPNETITIERRRGRAEVVDRDEHMRGRVPVSMLRNRARTDRETGRSEITRAVRANTDSGIRTLLGAEITREFYGAPQRYAMGADESMFVDEDGNRKSGWEAVIGRLLVLPRDDNDDLPQVGTFAAASPQPYTEQLKMYAQVVSSATGIPMTHFGFASDNPASADAIRMANDRLDARSIRRAKHYDLGLLDVAEVAVLWRDGEPLPPGSVGSHWRSPATPTPGAQADRAQKLIAAGVFPPDSDVTYEELSLTPQQIRRLKADKRRAQGAATLQGLRDLAAAARQDSTVADLSTRRAAGDADL